MLLPPGTDIHFANRVAIKADLFRQTLAGLFCIIYRGCDKRNKTHHMPPYAAARHIIASVLLWRAYLSNAPRALSNRENTT